MDVNKSILEGMVLENTFNDILNEKAQTQEENNTEVKVVAKKMATEVMKKIKEEKMQYLKVSGPNDDNIFSVENLAKLAEKLNNANYNKTIEGIEKSICRIVKNIAKEVARPAGCTVDIFNSDIGGKDAYITFGVYKKKNCRGRRYGCK